MEETDNTQVINRINTGHDEHHGRNDEEPQARYHFGLLFSIHGPEILLRLRLIKICSDHVTKLPYQ